MILLAILFITILLLGGTLLLFIGVGSVMFLFVFGDLIVAILGIWLAIKLRKKFKSRKKNKKSIEIEYYE